MKTSKPPPTKNTAAQNDSTNHKSTNGTMNASTKSDGCTGEDQIGRKVNGTQQTNGMHKSQWREKHEEFVKSIQTPKVNGIESSDEQAHKHESIDKESTITTNSESTTNSTGTTNTSSTTTSTITLNTTNDATNDDERSTNDTKTPKPKRKIQPPQATRLNRSKLNLANGQPHSNGSTNKQVNGQTMINDSSTSVMNHNHTTTNGINHQHTNGHTPVAAATSTTTTTKKSMNTAIECAFCGRTFNRAAGERHVPFCEEKQRQRKSSNSVTNEEALARFRLRNAYRSNKSIIKKPRDKSMPNEKSK